MSKPQRIRDPLHNLIEFGRDESGCDEFESVLWNIVQTRPFQRLRRVKQLGFSDLVYPGATHSRFAHSLGVFHTARLLMGVVRDHLGRSYKQNRAQRALAAALVHDIGHGAFSHAFEDVGAKLDLKMAKHETVSDYLIKNGEVADVLNVLGGGFATDVANIISRKGPSDIYDAVVSSQFDADRLDYMQRDRLMTGTQHGAIDFKWLLSNLQVGTVATGVDEMSLGNIETFVLGSKAIYAAEAYVLGLFQLYPTVYFHKATRGAEKIFTELFCRAIQLIQDGSASKTGLPSTHPVSKFALSPNEAENVLSLDDTVMWGAIYQMVDAEDKTVSTLALRLRDRNLYKSLNVRESIISSVESGLDPTKMKEQDSAKLKTVDKICIRVREKVVDWGKAQKRDVPRILCDETERSPYKELDVSKGPLNQIRILTSSGNLVDLGERSKVVRAIDPFRIFRVYVAADDTEAKAFVKKTINEEVQNAANNTE